ncbi:MAG: type IV pilus assembly protein PilM [Candidatus Aminicenantes bacterium]|jgi:type IV pilus assembly protein PilM
MIGIGRQSQVVGVDIGSYAIKVAELRRKNKGGVDRFSVKKLGYEILPRDAIVEGTIMDSATVAETIGMIFEENKISTKNVIISVSGNSVIIKKISLQAMEKEELAESIFWEAKHSLPYPQEEVNIDYTILPFSSESERKNYDVLLVAAKKDKISNYSNAVHQANRNPVAVEVDVFALLNAAEINYAEIFRDKTIAIINLGAGLTSVIISEKGIPQLFRDLPLGGSQLTENLSKELNIGFDDAEKILKGLPIEEGLVEQSRAALNLYIQNLLEEIYKTLSFYETGEGKGRTIDLILLCGGLSKITDLADRFEEKFDIQSNVLDPFRQIDIDRKRFDPLYFDELAAQLGVAIGLASRKPEK